MCRYVLAGLDVPLLLRIVAVPARADRARIGEGQVVPIWRRGGGGHLDPARSRGGAWGGERMGVEEGRPQLMGAVLF